jgi:hypothetical protein
MKNAKWLIVLMGVLALTACGSDGGGGGGDADAQAEAAFDDFGNAINACMATEENPCTCPGGGTIELDAAEENLTVANCVSGTGETYTGTFTTDDASATINGTMTSFGACSGGTANGIGTETCEGTLTISCPAGNVTCTIVDDASGESECDLECT